MANPEITNLDTRPVVISATAKVTGKTVLAGQGALAAGTVMGVIIATQKLKKVAAASADGSEYARYVLTQALAASAVDITDVEVLAAGEVIAEKLILGGAGPDTIDSVVAADGLTHREHLRANGIIVRCGDPLDAEDNH